MKRHSAPRILCSEQRDYSSSGMIRYVPKKSRNISEDLTSRSGDGSEKGIYASRLDHSVLGPQVKGNKKAGTFLDSQGKNDPASYMNVSCDDSDEGIMSLENGLNASGLGPGAKGNRKETGEGTFLHLQDINDAVMYCDASCGDSNEGIICLWLAQLWQCIILFLESNK